MSLRTALGYDRAGSSWVSSGSGKDIATVPPLDGTLLIDETALSEGAQDFGNVKHQRPSAVLEPGSAGDVVRMVDFARGQGIKIGPRGQRFSTFGEAQVPGGLAINMRALRQPSIFGPDWVEVSAGLSWSEVLSQSLERGLRPPVLTHNIGLSVGGSLSAGGLDGASYRYGAQVDNTLALQVVTGEGRLESCSDNQNPELFHAVLSGRGQCGVIIRATLRLVPAPTHALFFELLYPDLSSLLADVRQVTADGRFDRTGGYVIPGGARGWRYYIQASRNFNPPDRPDEKALLAGLHHFRGFESIFTIPYFDCADRGRRGAAELVAQGHGTLPHPFFCTFLPDSVFEGFLSEVLASIDPGDYVPDLPIDLFWLKTTPFSRPLLRIPAEGNFFLTDVLITAPNLEAAERIIQKNRGFYDRTAQLGGNVYPVSVVRLSPQDWRQHYGPVWEQFASAKRRFDPDNILTPGQGIFEAN